MCQLVAQVFLKNLVLVKYMSPMCPLFVTNHPHACQQSFLVYILVLICFLIATEVSRLILNNPGLFTVNKACNLMEVNCLFLWKLG